MSKFDTHGGYFSPDNYIRINEGGTHEENPNGGVQMGVDPEGVPNMVEEDETVYDDYVFSDNIYVDDAMVEKHNLPSWAKGKLYSKVTDRLVEEAEERPMDPISRSGLEEMLGRLRDAQEEQKQIQQERELEDELSQLSPEELDQLEAMLTPGTDQDGGVVGELGEQGLPPGAAVGPAEPVQQMPVEGTPMMRNGGFLHEYKDGGLASRIKKARAIAKAERRRIRYVSPHDRKILEKAGEIEGAERRQNLIEERTASYADAVSKRDSLQTVYNDALAALRSAEDAQLDAALNDGDFDAASKQYEEARDAMRSAKWQLKDANKSVRNANYLLGQLGVSAPLFQSVTTTVPLLDTTVAPADIPATILDFDDNPIGALTDTAAVNAAASKNRADYDPLADAKYHALGGQMNKFIGGGGLKPEDMQLMAVNDNGELVDDIVPSVVVAEPSKAKVPFYLPFILPSVSEKDEKKQEELERVKKEKKESEEERVNEFARALYFGNPDATANFLFDSMLKTPSYGRRSNRFDKGGYGEFYNLVSGYTPSRTRGGISGTYRIDRNFNPYMHGFSNIADYENSASYDAFTDAVVAAAKAGNRRALAYLQELDKGTPKDVEKLFVNGKLRDDFEGIFRGRRSDGDAGIYHLTPDGEDFSTFFDYTSYPALSPRLIDPSLSYIDKDGVNRMSQFAGVDLTGTSRPITRDGYNPAFVLLHRDPDDVVPDVVRADGLAQRSRLSNVGNTSIGNEDVTFDGGWTDPSIVEPRYKNNINDKRKVPYLSTFPRYAGALIAGGLGLYNAFQRPDRYDIPHINPVLPQGRLHLRDPRYNPLDEEQAVNTVLAANAGTNRQIMNSGIGPSVGATLLASDYNAGRNIGTARQTVWDANNQSRNAVTAAHNQNASALASFDYGQSRDRAQILNEAAYRNAQNDLLRQRLNYDAEGQKYAAIQSSLDSVAQALSGIGQENPILNALNSNTALYHWLSPNRVAAYKADTNESKDGGLLRKKKTKIEKEIEQQVKDLSEYGETLTKIERDERKKREAQQKIDNLWSPASPSELKRLFSGRKKKKN